MDKLFLRLLPLAFLLSVSISSNAASESSWSVSSANTWKLNNDFYYDRALGSPSNYLQLKEQLPHRELKIKVNKNIVESFSFAVGCVLQSKTPSIILRVSPLDISMLDSKNGFVFARFLVDDNQEFSLRGELASSGRIMFMPYTKAQNDKLSNLFLQLNEGGILKIALLQGVNTNPRLYELSLQGFKERSAEIVNDCNSLGGVLADSVKLLPDYLSEEPKNQAPELYSLKKKDETTISSIDSSPIPVNPEPSQQEVPPVHEFRPDGSVATIGPDGKPIMNNDSSDATQANDTDNTDNDSLGSAGGPMQIDENGMPIF